MLTIRPDLADENRISTTPRHDPYNRVSTDLFDSDPLSMYLPFDEYIETGTLGGPSSASAATGGCTLEAIGVGIATVLESIHEHVQITES